ncbi:hypothetical protein Cs7R123_79210 [Catellatospora sp. TT07R-123]|uniref:hypothetical protein n=1 Tax=Catellatospora sp. TT07R-123 TaxID=2733863 RepID=UPI001AFF159C|nr:hypothetical protein [Catellatospora sp. TT07R-123]GHJ50579.1 hypothetical protein Cs7R123_79210 [Catellatospora sp. TT07R-123]
MAESAVRGPQRDESGKIVALTDLLAYTVVGVLLSVAAMAVFDGVFALLGLGRFGSLNGWLAAVFPAMIFVEQFRAARDWSARLPTALLAAVVGVGLGVLATGFAAGLPALVSGALGALVATVVYAVVWHTGLAFVNR